ncbi:MAG: hypothetical protein KC441_19535, partial [Anaerolineales bacterium]|nr:hypothetical protein [Anaerolineales bacterium]
GSNPTFGIKSSVIVTGLFCCHLPLANPLPHKFDCDRSSERRQDMAATTPVFDLRKWAQNV